MDPGGYDGDVEDAVDVEVVSDLERRHLTIDRPGEHHAHLGIEVEALLEHAWNGAEMTPRTGHRRWRRSP